MSISSGTPSLTPSRSPSPEQPVQPDHFYGAEGIQLPPSPSSDGKTWLDPADDPLATRGIPVFKPSMEEFRNFEAYMMKVESWGTRSGIVKVIPPKEWTAALPPLKEQLKEVKIKSPIEQHMFGRGGLFRQENMEKRKVMSVREWAELCSKEDYRAPGVDEIGLHARSAHVKPKTRKTAKKKAAGVKAEVVDPGLGSSTVKEEPVDDARPFVFGDSGSNNNPIVLYPSDNIVIPISPPSEPADVAPDETENKSEEKPKVKKRVVPTREAKEAELAGRAARDLEFLETFEPHKHWLPPNTKPSDYTQEYCQKLERWYWRNCGLGKPAWYGADTMGSLYTDETTSWNVAHLESTLSRLLPASDQGLPGVNTPYLYFGMWRATFAWHVEDMDLFSINYIHFGAPKFWYAVPQARAGALEQTMRGYFPKDTSNCPQFLRHKSFLASPTLLAQSSCRPNNLVQHAGEFVITYPRGYHAGFNLGFNCAESVNFALDSWLELGRRAKACECIPDSVRIDVDQLLAERAAEAANPSKTPKPNHSSSKKENNNRDTKSKSSRKRKMEGGEEGPKPKKLKIKLSPSKSASTSQQTKTTLSKLSVTLKLGPKPTEPETYPCCLCISTNREGLLRVYDPPVGRKDAEDAAGNPKEWLAHEYCANVVPETWVDEIDIGANGIMEKVVFGVDGIVKDRWHLKCTACTKNRPKSHGAPIQCTKGKCPKAFHVSCARDGKDNGIIFDIVREVEKEVVLLEPAVPVSSAVVASEHSGQLQIDGPGPRTDGNGMNVDPSPTPSSRVLKVIKKFEVSVLCVQHNPAVAAAKKANKQDKIKADLLALPSMARIKIRVSAGVFEVSLIRVIEETSSVEVLWDRDVKREFKWGSVVFGNTDGPVQQRPSELAPESQPTSNGVPVPTYSSVTAAAATARYASQVDQRRPATSALNATSTQPYGAPMPGQYPYPPRTYDYWSYQNSQYSAGQPSHPYGYSGYYANQSAVAGPSHQYNPYAYNQNQYHPAQMNWQQPYHGQQPSAYYRPSQQPQQSQQHSIDQATPQALQASYSSTSNPPPQSQPSATDLRQMSSSSSQPAGSPPLQVGQAPAQTNCTTSPSQSSFSTVSQGAFKNLAALSSLEPSQISDILRENPQLRDIVLAALGEAQRVLPPPS